VSSNPAEYATIDENFNPTIHRIVHAIKDRAVHPDGPVPEMPEILTRFSAPPQELIQSTKAEIDTLIQAAEVKKGKAVHPLTPQSKSHRRINQKKKNSYSKNKSLLTPKKVPPKAKGKRKRETAKPLSGLDVDALLNQSRNTTEPLTTSIKPENAIPTFIQALSASEEIDHIRDATHRMAEIVRDQIRDSFGDAQYASVVEKMGVMRRELVALEEPGMYNDFIRDLKTRMLSGELNGDRRDMWWEIRIARLGLIHSGQSEFSDVSPDDADEVCNPIF
jgi:ATP-dependent DNA helicase 2 subunit 2